MSGRSPSLSTAGRWKISEVAGRRMPWRVHRVGTDPRISADVVFAVPR